MPASTCVVLISVPQGQAARKVANEILKTRAAACVNIVPAIESMYWWEGKIESAPESLLIVKTRRTTFERLKSVVRRVHPYTIPEIIELPITAGHLPYLDWVRAQVKA